MKTRFSRFLLVALVSATSLISVMGGAEEWPQLQGDALRSGNAAKVDVANSIGLAADVFEARLIQKNNKKLFKKTPISQCKICSNLFIDEANMLPTVFDSICGQCIFF